MVTPIWYLYQINKVISYCLYKYYCFLLDY